MSSRGRGDESRDIRLHSSSSSYSYSYSYSNAGVDGFEPNFEYEDEEEYEDEDEWAFAPLARDPRTRFAYR